MKTLVLCVDRDDDFGEKIRVNTPIIGRKNNLDAATAMLLTDPEESDANALFGAIKVYDELVSMGKTAEIVTICGGRQVNHATDEKLFKELEMAIYISKVKEVILITDGSEDEYILPMIGSRINIISKKKIVVKQSDKLESVYFYITRALEDEKTQKIIVPLGLFLIFAGITSLLGIGNVGYGSVALIIGLYLLIKTFHLEHPLNKLISDIRKSTGFTFIFTFIALITFMVGLALFIDGLQSADHNWKILSKEFMISFLGELREMVWWVIGATIFWTLGKVADASFTEDDSPWPKIPPIFFYVATGFIVNAVLTAIRDVIGAESVQVFELLIFSLFGFFTLVFWRLLHKYFEKQPITSHSKARGWRK